MAFPGVCYYSAHILKMFYVFDTDHFTESFKPVRQPDWPICEYFKSITRKQIYIYTVSQTSESVLEVTKLRRERTIQHLDSNTETQRIKTFM